jgi:hypothetical protein
LHDVVWSQDSSALASFEEAAARRRRGHAGSEERDDESGEFGHCELVCSTEKDREFG